MVSPLWPAIGIVAISEMYNLAGYFTVYYIFVFSIFFFLFIKQIYCYQFGPFQSPSPPYSIPIYLMQNELNEVELFLVKYYEDFKYKVSDKCYEIQAKHPG